MTATEARLKVIDFTAGTFPTRNVVVTREPRPAVATVEELARERVGTTKGTSLADTVASLNLQPAAVDDSIPAGQCLEMLATDRITACVVGVEEDAQAAATGCSLGP